jgi:hypothetical protein
MPDVRANPHRSQKANLGSFIRDRLLLLAVAFAVAVFLFSYFMVSDWLGLSDDAQFLLIQTVGLAVFAGSIRRFSPWRRRRLRLRWPLVATSVGLLLMHLATVGTYVIVYHPRWRGPHWEVVTTLDLAVFFTVLCWLDEYCTMDHRPTFIMFVARHLRIATGHIGVGDEGRT